MEKARQKISVPLGPKPLLIPCKIIPNNPPPKNNTPINKSPTNKKLIHNIILPFYKIVNSTSPPLAPPEPFHSLSFSSLTPPNLSHCPQTQTQSEDRLQHSPVKDTENRHKTQSVSLTEYKDSVQAAVVLCSTDLEAILDFQLRKTLKPLLDFKKIKQKVSLPFNFWGTPIVTTFVCSAGSRTQFLEKASQTDTGVRLAELEHPFLKKMLSLLCGKGPDLCSPFILESLKGAVTHGCWRSVQGWQSNH